MKTSARQPTVLLFDIDGTLVLTGGAGRRAMQGAFHEVYGRGDVFEGTSFGGMTDHAIARQGISAARPSEIVTREAIERVLDRYLAHLAAELPRSSGYRIMPGVVDLLAALDGVGKLAVGLGTGNVRRGAYAKLAHGALDGAFTFGGFGCDAEDRTELLAAGRARGAEALGVSIGECRVVVIGDTPKDVAAAKGIAAECVGVGTGGTAPRTLVELGAHHGFDTLADAGAHAAIVGELVRA